MTLNDPELPFCSVEPLRLDQVVPRSSSITLPEIAEVQQVLQDGYTYCQVADGKQNVSKADMEKNKLKISRFSTNFNFEHCTKMSRRFSLRIRMKTFIDILQ